MALIDSSRARNSMHPMSSRPVHPFFTKRPNNFSDAEQTSSEPSTTDSRTEQNGTDENEEKENFPSISLLAPQAGNPLEVDPSPLRVELQATASLEEDPNVSRRKRLKSSDGEKMSAQTIKALMTDGSTSRNANFVTENVQEADPDPDPTQHPPKPSEINQQPTVQVYIPPSEDSSQPTHPAAESSKGHIASQHGHILSLSGTGKLVTSRTTPNSGTESTDVMSSIEKRKPKARRVARRSQKPQGDTTGREHRRVLVLRYRKPDTGIWINDILSGQRKLEAKSTSTIAKSITAATAYKPEKPTHPFFARNPAGNRMAQSTSNTTLNVKDAIEHSVICQSDNLQQSASAPFRSLNLTVQSPFSKKSGAKEAPWPWRGTSSVTSIHESPLVTKTLGDPFATLALRKKKGNIASVLSSENVLQQTAARLHSTFGRDQSFSITSPGRNSFLPVLDSVRPPMRLERTSSGIESLLLEQLSFGKIAHLPGEVKTHAAILHLCSKIRHYLSPFDLGSCESLAWTQKYSPTLAEDVLQAGSEVRTLKDWLSGHCIHNVDTGNAQKPQAPDKKNRALKGRKKRKRADYLDGFIVDSSEEDEGYGSFTDLDGDIPSARPAQERSRVRKKPTRTSNVPAKNANVVLISGPHGCGKTAAVYAVARELDFEVFEINSGSKRSGKDILEKIGDMTENHLVQRLSKAASSTEEVEQDPGDNLEANLQFETIAEKGRQGNMTSFFKPVETQSSTKGSKLKVKDAQATKVADPQANMSKRQKQSLILFEEVDVLFEDDKQFWPTVIALAAHCKRPIVLTCTDESLVPMDSLTMHAVLRLAAPPVSMVTDYLLVMAAREGHVLERQAVEDLYITKRYDLRACITELNFRCQMGIGDRKGGLDWMINRWPPGCDLDPGGDRLRSVSKGTYTSGMEWENNDIVLDESSSLIDEVSLSTSLTDWSLPIDELAFSSSCKLADIDRLSTIKTLEVATNARSSADVFCQGRLRTGFKELLDPSHPDPTDKYRHDLVEGSRYISTESMGDFHSLSIPMASSALSLTSRILNDKYRRRQFPFLLRYHNDPLQRQQTASCLLAPLSALANPDPTSTSNIALTSLLRESSVQLLDIAPYIRSIASHDLACEMERAKQLLSSLGEKRMRLTRASRSAMEGGRREETRVRRERWWNPNVNLRSLLATGGPWMEACEAGFLDDGGESDERYAQEDEESGRG